MKKLELALTSLSIAAFIMKINLLAWSGPIFTFAMMGLCLVYLTSSYLYQNTSSIKELFQQIISTQRNLKYFGRGFTVILMASLLKLSFWGQSDILFIAGFIIIIINLAINYIRKSKSHLKIITRRIILICGIGLLVFLTPQNTIIDIHHRNNPEYAELLKRSIEEPNNKEIQEKLYQLQEDMFK